MSSYVIETDSYVVGYVLYTVLVVVFANILGLVLLLERGAQSLSCMLSLIFVNSSM